MSEQNVFFCVQSPGFYYPLKPERVKEEFSKAMRVSSNTESKFGDMEKVPAGSVIQGEVCDSRPLVVEYDSIFWQSETTFFEPNTLVSFARGLACSICDARNAQVTIVFMPYYAIAPLQSRLLSLTYVFGFLITPRKILKPARLQ